MAAQLLLQQLGKVIHMRLFEHGDVVSLYECNGHPFPGNLCPTEAGVGLRAIRNVGSPV